MTKWEIKEVRTERVLALPVVNATKERKLNLHAAALLIVKTVVVVTMISGLFFAINYGIDKEADFNNNVLNSHITAAQRIDVINRVK